MQTGNPLTELQLKALGIDLKYLDGLNLCFSRFNLNTPQRQAGFIGQCQHESMNFTILEENLNYSKEGLVRTWPARFNKDTAVAYHRNPRMIGSKVYANRMGNSNEASGEGWLYRGRGLIQLTGKQQYLLCGFALDVDLVAHPDLLTQVPCAVLSAGWYWDNNTLNRFCDVQDWKGLTKAINGGYNGLEDRLARIKKALVVLNT